MFSKVDQIVKKLARKTTQKMEKDQGKKRGNLKTCVPFLFYGKKQI